MSKTIKTYPVNHIRKKSRAQAKFLNFFLNISYLNWKLSKKSAQKRPKSEIAISKNLLRRISCHKIKNFRGNLLNFQNLRVFAAENSKF